jgi:hypothetical protein
MNATTYTGTGATLSVTNGAAGQAFQPDMVWIKSRSNALNHNLYDSVRGVQKVLSSNVTSAENYAGTGDLTAFDSNGFTVQQTANYQLSQSGYTYVGWNWKAGGTAVTNTTGTITSSVSANTTSGFSVVTYSGAGPSVNSTVGHGLGVTPQMIIVKARNATNYWIVWNTGLTSINYNMYLNDTSNQQADSQFTAVSSTTVTVYGGSTNQTGTNYVMYCWAPIAGYSAFGSYTGNGSADGPFVYLGFRPRFIMFKCSSNSGNWDMLDTSRNTYNVANYRLLAESSGAEITGAGVDIVSNGFKIRNTDTSYNGSGQVYIYMAFAETPLKFSNAR